MSSWEVFEILHFLLVPFKNFRRRTVKNGTLKGISNDEAHFEKGICPHFCRQVNVLHAL